MKKYEKVTVILLIMTCVACIAIGGIKIHNYFNKPITYSGYEMMNLGFFGDQYTGNVYEADIETLKELADEGLVEEYEGQGIKVNMGNSFVVYKQVNIEELMDI